MTAKDVSYYDSCGYAIMGFGQYLGSRLRDIPDSYLFYLMRGGHPPVGGKLVIYASWRLGFPQKKFTVSYNDDGVKSTCVMAFSRQDALRIFRRDFHASPTTRLKVSELSV